MLVSYAGKSVECPDFDPTDATMVVPRRVVQDKIIKEQPVTSVHVGTRVRIYKALNEVVKLPGYMEWMMDPAYPEPERK